MHGRKLFSKAHSHQEADSDWSFPGWESFRERRSCLAAAKEELCPRHGPSFERELKAHTKPDHRAISCKLATCWAAEDAAEPACLQCWAWPSQEMPKVLAEASPSVAMASRPHLDRKDLFSEPSCGSKWSLSTGVSAQSTARLSRPELKSAPLFAEI